jgi:hypothetical protein
MPLLTLIVLGLGVFALLVVFAVMARYLRLWVQSVASGAGIGLFDLVAMSFKKVNPAVIVRSKIMAVQAGLGDSTGITKQALEAIQTNQSEIWIPILLLYYDKTYEFDLQRHEVSKTIRLTLQGLSLEDQVTLLLQTKPKVNGTSHPTH